jgi:hypothetical protein
VAARDGCKAFAGSIIEVHPDLGYTARVTETASPMIPWRSRVFWLFWGFDALVAAVVVFFFLWGLSDGTVSSFNIALWLGMLVGVAGVVFGSLGLRRTGHTAAGFGLLMILALPGLMFVLFFVVVIILHPRWN